MKLQVLATDESWNELNNIKAVVEWIRVVDLSTFLQNDADACFNLMEDAGKQNYSGIQKPVFINSVSQTLKELGTAANVLRINGWNSFIKRDSWEISGQLNNSVISVLEAIQKKYVHVQDEPGFVTARILSMIINEAYFTRSENISSAEEIDIAMKLGTGYPYGPFEWAGIIGLRNIFELLQQLAIKDERYIPSGLLKKEALNNNA